MLGGGVPVIYLLCLSLTEAMLFFHNVQFIPIEGVTTVGDECILFGKRFSGRLHIPGRCQTWSCYPNTSNVVVVRCGPLPNGCYTLGGLDQPLPKCCNIACDPYKFACLTPEGKLLRDGEEYNSRRPCVRYTCKSGALITMTCQGYADLKCSAANINPFSPYPSCCGVGRVCPS
ncbi:uncharacterized protein LOC119432412 isoform X1 [Dermacentor silvarum]|uniref:uncharacterized protein LOC119432412 isoform X1 n=1 Tax=Dermacentor silvarum TaxID=543639 RepID=UPI002101C760|nr:uncharacterized protein LOC119432412 isoform X1 [Dermacentor silvarum]XP_049515014.1 uncharacterized protein LOC119432412 isoform X1 [Dermacentor silvarum]XP_049515015.1 uncharacterized protein LOC119432412 isoform X1 [Dermacentor silvarum]